MCGIAGIKRFGNSPITPYQLKMLAVSLEHRGRDATGIALMAADGTIHICKEDKPAWDFVIGDKFKTFVEEHLSDGNDIRVALVHVRAATQGQPEKNENNHPLSIGLSAIVHNGIIANDQYLFNSLKLERHAQTDSDIIRAIVDKYGLTEKAIRELNRISGTVAAACIHPGYPDKILFLKSGNPLVFSASVDMLTWASEKHALYKALRPFVIRHGLHVQVLKTDLGFALMPEDSAWIHEGNKVRHFELKTAKYYGQAAYNKHNGSVDAPGSVTIVKANGKGGLHETVSGEIEEKIPEFVVCGNDKCQKLLMLEEEQRKLPLWKFVCKACKTPLDEMPVN